MSDLQTIIENYSVLDTAEDLRERIANLKHDIEAWEKTIDDNTSKIVDLCFESVTCREDIHRAKLDMLRLSERLVAMSRTAVIQ